ncbi:PREDICTED: uncharacterized protein LOC109126986 [Camelina sativa]|uniref:Uncharacterized protein LOC109126986 n=1 Tax=Camelina sativa TaxID=90675 RepID=A0ABM1QIH6_CAMSA|nr:PREDICTED: uncharacterized protein LOC109126986 [Camelina sativa]
MSYSPSRDNCIDSSRLFSLMSVDRRLPAVFSGDNNGKTVTTSITVFYLNLFKSCVVFWIRQVDQSENYSFPLFLLIMADKIRRQMQEIALGIEDDAITLLVDLCEEAIQETRFSLIVKPVNLRKQNLRAMLSTLPRLWGVPDEVSGRIMENKKIQFLFHSEESMAEVLRRGPWSFNDWMCVTQRWNPAIAEDGIHSIPF